MTLIINDIRCIYECSLFETRLNNLLIRCVFVTQINCSNQNKIPHSRLTAVSIQNIYFSLNLKRAEI